MEHWTFCSLAGSETVACTFANSTTKPDWSAVLYSTHRFPPNRVPIAFEDMGHENVRPTCSPDAADVGVIACMFGVVLVVEQLSPIIVIVEVPN